MKVRSKFIFGVNCFVAGSIVMAYVADYEINKLPISIILLILSIIINISYRTN